MPAKQEGEKPTAHPENLSELKERIVAAWEQMPPEHQATMLLVLLEKLMESEYRAWIKQAISLRWPLETELLPTAFTLIQITREDLVEAHFHEDELAELTGEDLQTIAQTIRSHYVHDVFWPELAYVTEAFLEAKNKRNLEQRLEEASAADADFQVWMSQIISLRGQRPGAVFTICQILIFAQCLPIA